MKSAEQKEKEKQDRLAAEEAREAALKGAKGVRKARAEASKTEAPVEKPRRERKRGDEISAPSKRRGKTGVKTG